MKAFFTLLTLVLLLISCKLDAKQINAKQLNDFATNQGEFIANYGQWDSNILSIAEAKGYKVIVKKDGIYFDYYNVQENKINGQVVKLAFDNQIFDFQGLEAQIGKYNYFLGNDEKKWKSNVPVYNKIKLNEIIDGVDVILQMQDQNPRYDLIVKSGQNPENIKLKFSGVDQILSNKNGNLALGTSLGEIEIGRLIAYQLDENSKQINVDCKFVVSNNQVSFKLGKYDKSLDLIIDPTVYSSFEGGKGDDNITNIISPNSNEILIVGTTNSNDLNVTEGAYSAYLGEHDGFVAKYAINFGKFDLIFKSYIGSTGDDYFADLGLDLQGNIVMCGYTESATFPVKKNFGADFRAAKEAFIMKLDPTASSLIYSGLVNGKNDEVLNALEIDGTGNVVAVGYTNSNDITKVAGVNGKSYVNAKDVYEIKLNSDGSVLHTNIFGGNFDDYATDVSLNSSGDIFIAGSSKSTDYPMYPIGGFSPGSHPYDDTHNGGWDAIVTVIDAQGATLSNSTYVGGTGDDLAMAIYGYDDFSFVISGQTKKGSNAPYFPTTTGAVSNESFGAEDIFISRLEAPVKGPFAWSNYSQRILNSTLYGSSGEDLVLGMKYSKANNSFVVFGTTSNSNFPKVNDDNSKYSGMKDIFVSEFDVTFANVIYSSIFGGKKDDIPNAIVIDNDASFTLVGNTNSTDWKQTNNAKQASYKGGLSDGFVLRNVFGTLNITAPGGEGTYCKGTVLNISWSQSNLNTKAASQIELVKKSTGEKTLIVSNLLDVNNYIWNIPSTIEAANDYYISISHASGAYDLSDIMFEIADSPKINEFKALSQTSLCEGEELNIKVSASGKSLNYVWYQDDKEIPNQTNSVLSIKNLISTQSGNYKVKVEGLCNPLIISDLVKIEVIKNTKITKEPEDVEVNENTNAKITLEAEGKNLSYQWLKANNPLLGANSSVYEIPNAIMSDSGDFKCIVTGICGADTSNIVRLKVKSTGSISSDREELFARITENNQSILTIQLKDESEKINIDIFDVLGNSIELDKSAIQQNGLVISLNLQKLPRALYLISLNQNNRFQTIKYLPN